MLAWGPFPARLGKAGQCFRYGKIVPRAAYYTGRKTMKLSNRFVVVTSLAILLVGGATWPWLALEWTTSVCGLCRSCNRGPIRLTSQNHCRAGWPDDKTSPIAAGFLDSGENSA